MAYSLKLHEDRVTRFLRNLEGLSRQGRIRLFINLHFDLRINADTYRAAQEMRLGPNSPYFWYHLTIQDDEGDQRTRQFSFIVNDAAAAYGVLQVEYVHVTESPP